MRKSGLLMVALLLTISPFIGGCATNQPQPEIAQAYKYRGLNELILNSDYNKSLADLTQAIEFNPADTDSYVGRGLVYLKQGNAKAAREDFDKASSLNPELKKILLPLLNSAD